MPNSLNPDTSANVLGGHRPFTHETFQNPYGGVPEAFAQGVYEAPGQLAGLVDALTRDFRHKGQTLQQQVDKLTGANQLGYNPENYSGTPAVQGAARLSGNIIGDPLNAIPIGMVGGKGGRAFAGGVINDISNISDELLRPAMINQGGSIGVDDASTPLIGMAEKLDKRQIAERRINKMFDRPNERRQAPRRQMAVRDDEPIRHLSGLAQEPLPMDEASRMTRAKEQGFDTDTTLYHGTNQDIEEFSKKYMGHSTQARSAEKAIWFSDSADAAEEFSRAAGRSTRHDKKYIDDRVKVIAKEQKEATRRKDWDAYERLGNEWEELELGSEAMDIDLGRNIIPTNLKMENPYIYDFGDELATSGRINEITDDAIEGGYDGLIIKNLEDSAEGIKSNHYAVFDTQNIRSKFAKFDPAKRNSANLLAGGAAAAIGINSLNDKRY